MSYPAPAAAPQLPWRACLLSGGMSRRMGSDKALLPHPEGGCWLERTLRLLAQLELPLTLLSRHPPHLELARTLALPQLDAMAEPPPWEGPLLALHRLMEQYPDQTLLLCPVDMPALSLVALDRMRTAAAADPAAIHIAHDGSRRQPLLAVLPGDGGLRRDLAAAVGHGERRVLAWLERHPCRDVALESGVIRNVNRPEQLPG